MFQYRCNHSSPNYLVHISKDTTLFFQIFSVLDAEPTIQGTDHPGLWQPPSCDRTSGWRWVSACGLDLTLGPRKCVGCLKVRGYF